MPGACPVCGSPVVEEGAYHFCTGGLSCPAQLKRGIEHFASKGALDIEGLGTKTVAAMVDRGLVASVADLYRLDETALLALEGFADKSAANLLDGDRVVEEGRARPLPLRPRHPQRRRARRGGSRRALRHDRRRAWRRPRTIS